MEKLPRFHSGKFQVYALSDPETDELRYIGITILTLERRLSQHMRPATLRGDYRSNWIKSLRTRGLRAKIELVEEVASVEAMKEAEQFWICQFRALGFRLTNGTDGGNHVAGSHKPKSKEQKAKISASLTGRIQPRELVELRRQKQLGIKKSPRTREHQINHLLANGKRPFQDENGKVFWFIKEAAEFHNLSYSTVIEGLHGTPTRGHAFVYVDDVDAPPPPPAVEKLIATSTSLRLSKAKMGHVGYSKPRTDAQKQNVSDALKGRVLRARPFTDGVKVFQTIGQAAEHFGVGRALIRNCLNRTSRALNLWHVDSNQKDVG